MSEGKRTIRKRYIAALLFLTGILLLQGSSLTAQVQVEASLSRDTVWIGDQLELTLRVVQPPGLKVTIPDYRDTIPSGLEVVTPPVTDTVTRKDGRLEITRRWKITSFDTTGGVQVGPFEVSWQQDSLTARLQTRPLVLIVRLPEVDVQSGPKEIKEPLKVPLTWQEVLMWGGIALLLLAALFFLIRWWRRRKEKPTPGKKTRPAEPPHVIALRELKKLEEEKLWQQGKVKEYYTRLTDILRTYLEYRYDVKALEQTTAETIEALRKAGFREKELVSLLESILSTGDLVKFAKYRPEPDVNNKVLQDTYRFVRETIPSWKEEEKEEKNGQEIAAERVPAGQEGVKAIAPKKGKGEGMTMPEKKEEEGDE